MGGYGLYAIKVVLLVVFFSLSAGFWVELWGGGVKVESVGLAREFLCRSS
jgi:hypothetical protein